MVSSLRVLNLSWCSFARCPAVGDLVALEELLLSDCKELKELPNLQRLTKLRKLEVFNRVLKRAVPGLGALVAQEELGARGCYELGELPDLRMLIHLQVLDLGGSRVSALVGLDSAISLRRIYVLFEGLESWRDLQMLTELQVVRVNGGWSSQGLPCLSMLLKLEDLSIRFCSGAEVLTGLSNLSSLRSLWIFRCDFKDVSCVNQLSTLWKLSIWYCEKLERLPGIHKLTRLESLDIKECRSLGI